MCVCGGWKRVCVCVKDGRGCVRVWRMEEGVCVCVKEWKRVCVCVEDGGGGGCVCAWKMEEGVCVCGRWKRVCVWCV